MEMCSQSGECRVSVERVSMTGSRITAHCRAITVSANIAGEMQLPVLVAIEVQLKRKLSIE